MEQITNLHENNATAENMNVFDLVHQFPEF